MAKATPSSTSVTRTTRAPKGELKPSLPADLLRKLATIDRFAVETFADSGIAYFNPLIGMTESETFGNIESIVQLMHEVLDPDNECDLYSVQHGLHLLTTIVWTTVQYESHRLSRLEGGAA